MTKKKNDSDTDVQRYARLFDMLDAHLPISDAFEAEDPQKTKRWWASQRQHMGCYFAGRATRLGNWSAKEAYADLQHAEGIMWMAEALDADTDVTDLTDLLKSLSEKVFCEDTPIPRTERAKFLREHLPWSLIRDLAQPKLDTR